MGITITTLTLGRRGGAHRSLAAVVAVVAAVSLLSLAIGAAAQTQTPTSVTTPPVCGIPTAADQPCAGFGQFDIYFAPNTATIPSDQDVDIALKNNGVTEHNFSVTDHGNAGLKNLNVSVTVKPGESGSATINAPAGDYYFFCNLPGHEAAGMRGYLTVKPDADVTSASATVTPRPE